MTRHSSSDNATPNSSNQVRYILIALALLVLTSLFVEHSVVDLSLAKLFYQGDGHWIISKQDRLLFMIFYTIPKYLLMAVAAYILAAYLARKFNKNLCIFYPCNHLSLRSLAYLSLALLSTPLIVGLFKAITHVACPVNLSLFGGDLPYVSFVQSMALALPAKCFPAAHASVGFALYAFAFVPELYYQRIKIILTATILGIIMGSYKMLIGDHFLSHTIASLLTAWIIASSLAMVFFRQTKLG